MYCNTSKENRCKTKTDKTKKTVRGNKINPFTAAEQNGLEENSQRHP